MIATAALYLAIASLAISTLAAIVAPPAPLQTKKARNMLRASFLVGLVSLALALCV